MKRLLLLVSLSVGLIGCINSDESKDYDGALHYQMGLQAEQQGNLPAAREYYAKAQKNAHSGRLGPAKEAYASYAWARVSGYLGQYADAEKGFETALALIDKTEGDADNLRAPVLFELARMFHDIGEHPKAVRAFAKAFAELDRVGINKIEPWAYISFLDDNAQSLKANGSAAAAEEMSKRSAAMKERFKGTEPRMTIQRYKT